MNITIDIETIPCQWPGIREEFAAAITAPGIYKKPESIKDWLDANREIEGEAAWLKTSFDGGMGQIVCIAWACDGGEACSVQVNSLQPQAEADMLGEFFHAMSQLHSTSGTRPVLVGHNVAAFDLPFIWKRAVVRGINPPIWWPRDPKPWGDTVFDTMTQWSGVKDRISLDKLCRVLGIEGKAGGPTGADVWPMVQSDRIDDVAAYCRHDVAITRAAFMRMTFLTPPIHASNGTTELTN